jgi:uncharacterized Zn-binding protein involved in type VI secretion
MPPAARVKDLQVSPGNSGPLTNGSSNVNIGGAPAVRAGDPAGGGVVASGSPTVFIGGKPAARVGDRSSGGGLLLTGTPNVLIGDRPGVGRLEAVGGGPSAGTPPKPGDEKKLKELEKKEKKEQDKKEKEKKEQEKKDAKAKDGATEEGEGPSLLGSPATLELVSAFLKMTEGLLAQLAGVLPPGMREMVSTALAQAQKAFGGMQMGALPQMGALNQSLAQLQAALQQVQTTVPPDVMATAAQNAAGPQPQPDAPADGPIRLNVGEGSVLDEPPPPRKG